MQCQRLSRWARVVEFDIQMRNYSEVDRLIVQSFCQKNSKSSVCGQSSSLQKSTCSHRVENILVNIMKVVETNNTHIFHHNLYEYQTLRLEIRQSYRLSRRVWKIRFGDGRIV